MNPTQDQLSKYAAAVFQPGDPLEIRLLPSLFGSSPQSFGCFANDLPSWAGRLLAENQRGFNIFVGINPRKAPGLKGDHNVSIARTLFADFDNVTIDVVRQRIATSCLPAPTMTVNSGHGFHTFWRLKEPVADLARWTALQKKLAALLGSDPKCCNPERILRLPGFTNHKAPKAIAEILEF